MNYDKIIKRRKLIILKLYKYTKEKSRCNSQLVVVDSYIKLWVKDSIPEGFVWTYIMCRTNIPTLSKLRMLRLWLFY